MRFAEPSPIWSRLKEFQGPARKIVRMAWQVEAKHLPRETRAFLRFFAGMAIMADPLPSIRRALSRSVPLLLFSSLEGRGSCKNCHSAKNAATVSRLPAADWPVPICQHPPHPPCKAASSPRSCPRPPSRLPFRAEPPMTTTRSLTVCRGLVALCWRYRR
jgi:hypothetical protein